MKDTITAHIKLDDNIWAALSSHASHNDLSTAQLVRKILRGWLEQQVFTEVTDDGPVRAQSKGHPGFDPKA